MRNYRTIKLDLWQDELPPALNSEQNRKLIAEYQKSGDIEIRNKIIEGNLHFVAYYVIYFCKKYISKILSPNQNSILTIKYTHHKHNSTNTSI